MISAAPTAITPTAVISALGQAAGPVSFNGQALTNVASVAQAPATALTIGGNAGGESLSIQANTTIGIESPGNVTISSYAGALALKTAARTPVLTLDATGNLLLWSGAGIGGGSLVLSIANCAEAPTTNPTGGGILYVDAGTLFYRGPSGTITPLGLP